MPIVTLDLYQHAWTANDYEPDGVSYATAEEATAAEAAAARDLLDAEDADDVADALERDGNTSADRLEEVRGGADLTDEEAITAAQTLRGYDSDTYPVGIKFDLADLLRAIVPVDGGPSVAALVETLADVAAQVVDRWQTGDLAQAVNALEQVAADVRAALPLDYDPA